MLEHYLPSSKSELFKIAVELPRLSISFHFKMFMRPRSYFHNLDLAMLG
jgi:predicted nucleic acid binding AN1-type Zn finger protein